MDTEMDFFKAHDDQMKAELNRFQTLSAGQNTGKSQLLQLRSVVVENSQDYVEAVKDVLEHVDENVGYEHPRYDVNLDSPQAVQTVETNKLLAYIDAMIYDDLLNNNSQEYDGLMEKRDSLTTTKEAFEQSFDVMVEKSNDMEPEVEHEAKLERVLEAVKESAKGQEQEAQIER